MSNSRIGSRGGRGGSKGGGEGGDGGGGGGFKDRRVTTCSFCGKTSREVGPMVEGPNDVYICSSCTELCQNIFKQERRRVHSTQPKFGKEIWRATSAAKRKSRVRFLTR